MLTAATAIESLLQGSPPRARFQTRLLSSKSDLCRPEGCMTSSEIREGRGLSLQSAGLESEEASSANSEVDSSSCLELPDREKNPVKGRDNPKIHYAPDVEGGAHKEETRWKELTVGRDGRDNRVRKDNSKAG